MGAAHCGLCIIITFTGSTPVPLSISDGVLSLWHALRRDARGAVAVGKGQSQHVPLSRDSAREDRPGEIQTATAAEIHQRAITYRTICLQTSDDHTDF